MAYTTINKSSDHFNTKLFTGNGATNAITGVGFQPDWTWIKNRSRVEDHVLYDAVRGVTKRLESNTDDAEDTKSNGLTAFGTDGFTVGSAGQSNYNGDNIVSWNWKANGTGSANTNGSINSTVSANTTSGFSIVSWTGTGTSGARTIGHGLGATPKMIITKKLTADTSWYTYHSGLTSNNYEIYLESANAQASGGQFQQGVPTSSLFTVYGNGILDNSGATYIAYCFAEKTGYSKFGSYTGNGNADGTFVYTGFKPAFVMVKSSSHAINWSMIDNTRDPDNTGTTAVLRPNKTDTEDDNSAYNVELLSNGFKNRNTNSSFNNPSYEYIYMAFAEAPLVGTNNIPCTAR